MWKTIQLILHNKPETESPAPYLKLCSSCLFRICRDYPCKRFTNGGMERMRKFLQFWPYFIVQFHCILLCKAEVH